LDKVEGCRPVGYYDYLLLVGVGVEVVEQSVENLHLAYVE